MDVTARDGFYVQGADGEKFVTNSDILNYNVVVASYTPIVSTDPCISGGEARLYAFKIYCAEGMFEDGSGNPVTNISLGDGMPTDPRISLSGTSGEIFINKNDRVESIDTDGIDLEQDRHGLLARALQLGSEAPCEARNRPGEPTRLRPGLSGSRLRGRRSRTP